MTRLDLSASVKLTVIWIINTRVLLQSKPNLGFDLILVFYCKCCIFRIIHFYIVIFFLNILLKNLYLRMNKLNIHANIIDIFFPKWA